MSIETKNLTQPTLKRTYRKIGRLDTIEMAPSEGNLYLDIRANDSLGNLKSYFGSGSKIVRLDSSNLDDLISQLIEARKEIEEYESE